MMFIYPYFSIIGILTATSA